MRCALLWFTFSFLLYKNKWPILRKWITFVEYLNTNMPVSNSILLLKLCSLFYGMDLVLRGESLKGLEPATLPNCFAAGRAMGFATGKGGDRDPPFGWLGKWMNEAPRTINPLTPTETRLLCKQNTESKVQMMPRPIYVYFVLKIVRLIYS